MRVLKYMLLVVSIGIAILISGISGCLMAPYSVGEPDSLLSEYVLVWDLIDSHYACFFAKDNVDWDESYHKFKSAAEDAHNRSQLLDICIELMSEFEDQNLILRDAQTVLESWNQGDFLNWDLNVLMSYIQDWILPDSIEYLFYYDAMVISTALPADTVGYVYISNLGSGFDVLSFYSVTYAIAECSSIILDLRMCNESGFEVNALYAIGRFSENAVLSYYKSIRTGPGRNDMGEMQEVFTNRNGAWQFTDPIVLLTGRDTQGAAEQLVLLLKTQQHVTVIGDTTAGFANPAVSFNLTADWTIKIPEMVTYSLDNTLILNSGIAPDIYIPVSEADFAAGIDPVLDAAIEMIVD
ncbi:MAG: hypothetical protein K8S15_03105 [Candidatus Aegiribacteria sp.]|nr:hypothetical protein [Candidatus Aegiribacteria sp.]